MDIAGLSIAMSTISTQSAYGVAMLGKSLDQVASMGDQITEMIDTAGMELSVNPNVGANIDIRV